MEIFSKKSILVFSKLTHWNTFTDKCILKQLELVKLAAIKNLYGRTMYMECVMSPVLWCVYVITDCEMNQWNIWYSFNKWLFIIK